MTTRLQMLEKLINRSTLSTQRAEHTHVIKIGGNVLDNFEDDKEKRFQQELAEALADAEAQAEREKQRALMRLTRQMEEAQAKALKNQKEYFEKMAERVAEQRDRLEAERMQELTEKLNAEKAEELRLQWEEAERQKAQAVEDACDALTKKLNKEHRLDKEMGIAMALKKAREGFQRRLEETIKETTLECERLASEEAARVAELTRQEIQRHDIRYGELKEKYDREHAHRLKVDSDFNALQTDYQRFMNYTDGYYHSDYMMSLRRHGMRISEKRLSDVSEYEEKPFRDIILPTLSTRNKSATTIRRIRNT